MLEISIQDKLYELSIMHSRQDWTTIIYYDSGDIYDIYVEDPNSPYLHDYIVVGNVKIEHIQDIIMEYYNNGVDYFRLSNKLEIRNPFFNNYVVNSYIGNLISTGKIPPNYVGRDFDYVGLDKLHIYINISSDYLDSLITSAEYFKNILESNYTATIINPICNKHEITFGITLSSREFSYTQYMFDKIKLNKYIIYAKLNTGIVKIYHSYVLNNLERFLSSKINPEWIDSDIVFFLQNHSENIMSKTFHSGAVYIGSSQLKVTAKDFVNSYFILNNISDVFGIDKSKITSISRSNIRLEFNVDIGNIPFIKSIASYVIYKYMTMFNINTFRNDTYSDISSSIEFEYSGLIFSLDASSKYGTFYNAYSIDKNINYLGIQQFTQGTIINIMVKTILSAKDISRIFTFISMFFKIYAWYIVTDPDGFIQLLRPNIDNVSEIMVSKTPLKLSGMARDKLYVSGNMAMHSRGTDESKPGFGTKEQYDEIRDVSKRHYQFEFLGKTYDEYIFCISPKNIYLTDKISRISFFFEDVSFPKCFDSPKYVNDKYRSKSTKKAFLYEYIMADIPDVIKNTYMDVLKQLNQFYVDVFFMGNVPGVWNFIYSIASTRIINENYRKFMSSNDIFNDIEIEVYRILNILRLNSFRLNPLKYLSDKEFNLIIQSDKLYIDPVKFGLYVQATLEVNILFLEQIGVKFKRVYPDDYGDIPVYNYRDKLIIILHRDTSNIKGDTSIYRCESVIIRDNIGYTQLFESLNELSGNKSIYRELPEHKTKQEIIHISPKIVTDIPELERVDVLLQIRNKFVSLICWGLAKYIQSNYDILNRLNRRDLIVYFINTYMSIKDNDIDDLELYKNLLQLEFIRRTDTFEGLIQTYFGSDKIPVDENMYHRKLYVMLFVVTKDVNLLEWSRNKLNYDIFVKQFYLSINDYSPDYLSDNIIFENQSQLVNIIKSYVSNKIITDLELMKINRYGFYTVDDEDNLYFVKNVKISRKTYRNNKEIDFYLLSWGKITTLLVNAPRNGGFERPFTFDTARDQMYMIYPGTNNKLYGIIFPV